MKKILPNFAIISDGKIYEVRDSDEVKSVDCCTDCAFKRKCKSIAKSQYEDNMDDAMCYLGNVPYLYYSLFKKATKSFQIYFKYIGKITQFNK